MSRISGSERVSIEAPEGTLDGLWLPAGASAADRAVLLCHPHPLHGGTMETKLVARTARRLSEGGYQTLRFNFRGVGRSEGSWSGGPGECEDARAALEYGIARLPEARFAIFGFSFGAAVALSVGAGDSRVKALVAVAPPIRFISAEVSRDCVQPKLVVAAGRDEIVDPEALTTWAQSLAGPSEFLVVDDADHLFTSQVDVVGGAVVGFLDRTLV